MKISLLVFVLLFWAEGSDSIHQLHVRRGKARKIKHVHWYHFPKSGGTTLRQILHDVCVNEGFNMTTLYGLPNEHTSLPNCCAIGHNVNFLYGHAIPPLDFSDNTLRIIMLRDPLSWIISRYQYHSKSIPNSAIRSLPDAIIQWGSIYFKYFDVETTKVLNGWFDRQKTLISGADAASVMMIAHRAQSRIDNIFEHSMVVLINEYFQESLEYLNFLYDTTHFTSSLKESRNTATSQDLATPIGTAHEIKTAMQLLQPHYAVYNTAMKYFMERVRTRRLDY